MNTTRFVTMTRSLLAAGAVAVSAAAQAHGVYWAVNVDAPAMGYGRVATVVSNVPGGVYVQPPAVYAPAPVVYAPQPVIVQRPVCYGAAPVYMPPVQYVEPRGAWWWHHRYEGDREDWDGDRWGRRWEHRRER
jgi:hypothetical protein